MGSWGDTTPRPEPTAPLFAKTSSRESVAYRGPGMETRSRAGTEQRPGDLFLGVPLTVFLRKESLGLMTGPSLVGGGSRHVAVCGPRALTGCSVLCPQLPQSLSPTLTEVTTPPCQPSPAVCRPAPPGASVALAVLPGAAAPRGWVPSLVLVIFVITSHLHASAGPANADTWGTESSGSGSGLP